MKCQNVIDMLERLAPKKLAEEWDNPGLLVGSQQQEVSRVLVCLDVSLPVVEEAVRLGAEMIVAHHPMIFKGLRHVRTDLYDGRLLQLLLSHNIAVYAAHTNLDIATGGVNDVLAKRMGLERVQGFVFMDAEKKVSMGRIGYLPNAMPLDEFIEQIKNGLGVKNVRLVRANEKLVQKVALCSGAGAEFIAKAAFRNADVYVTGDVKYHEAQQAIHHNINVIDAGHFGTEFPVVEVLAEYLRTEATHIKKDLAVSIDKVSKDYFELV